LIVGEGLTLAFSACGAVPTVDVGTWPRQFADCAFATTGAPANSSSDSSTMGVLHKRGVRAGGNMMAEMEINGGRQRAIGGFGGFSVTRGRRLNTRFMHDYLA
jgi:hypothetical protein